MASAFCSHAYVPLDPNSLLKLHSRNSGFFASPKNRGKSKPSTTCRVCSQRLTFALNLTLSMQTLVEKIEANAATRLALPPGVAPAQELPRFKNFVKVESHRLKIMHRAGGSGLAICRGRRSEEHTSELQS